MFPGFRPRAFKSWKEAGSAAPVQLAGRSLFGLGMPLPARLLAHGVTLKHAAESGPVERAVAVAAVEPLPPATLNLPEEPG
jgi:hypothetical protein